MLPEQLTAASFGGYPPEAKQLATAQLPVLPGVALPPNEPMAVPFELGRLDEHAAVPGDENIQNEIVQQADAGDKPVDEVGG